MESFAFFVGDGFGSALGGPLQALRAVAVFLRDLVLHRRLPRSLVSFSRGCGDPLGAARGWSMMCSERGLACIRVFNGRLSAYD